MYGRHIIDPKISTKTFLGFSETPETFLDKLFGQFKKKMWTIYLDNILYKFQDNISDNRTIFWTFLNDFGDSFRDNLWNNFMDNFRKFPWTISGTMLKKMLGTILVWINLPASHSSSPSTRRFPQKLSSGSVKHRDDFASKTLRIKRRLHGENFLLLTS